MAFTLSRQKPFLVIWLDEIAEVPTDELNELGQQWAHVNSSYDCMSLLLVESLRQHPRSTVIVICESILSEDIKNIQTDRLVSAFFVLSSNVKPHDDANHPKCQGIYTNRAELIDAVKTFTSVTTDVTDFRTLTSSTEVPPTSDDPNQRNSSSLIDSQSLSNFGHQPRVFLSNNMKSFLDNSIESALIDAKQRFVAHITATSTMGHQSLTSWTDRFRERSFPANQEDVIRYLNINHDLASYFHELWRKENFDQLEYLSFITTALTEQIKSNALRNTSTASVLQLYRSEFVNNEFIKTIRENLNNLIMFRGFWSASLFDERNTSELTNLLFIINIDLTLQHRSTFAELSRWIENSGRCEVIFSLGSVFRIESIDFEAETSFYTVNLSLVADNRIAVDMFVRPVVMTDPLSRFENAIRYGNLFYYANLTEFALECYLKIDPDAMNDRSLDYYKSAFYGNIGLCYFYLGEKNKARDTFNKHIEAEEINWGPSSLTMLYTQLAKLFLESNDSEIAEEFAGKALARQGRESETFQETTNLLGSIYSQQSNYEKVEECLYQAFRMKLDHYHHNNGSLSQVVVSCKALGDFYEKQGRFHLALGYYRYASNIYNEIEWFHDPYLVEISQKVASIEQKLTI